MTHDEQGIQSLTRWRRPVRIAVEIAIAFAALAALDWWLTGGTGFARVQPNPYWLPVLVMALAYGTGPGVLAAAIASGLWLAHVHDNPGERDYLDHLFHLSLQPLMWFVVAGVIGEVTIIRTGRHDRLETRGRVATRNLARLTEAFATLSQTNRQLQVQIATEAHTVGHAIETAARLCSPDPAERRGAIAELIALAARTPDFTCYRVTGDEARAWLRGPVTAGRRDVLPAALMERIERHKRVLHVAKRSDRHVLDGIGVAAIALPDRKTGEVVGCLVLHTLPFEALNASRTAELAEITTWLTPLLAAMPNTTRPSVRSAGLVA
ncbi:hypothetical protein C8J46_105494 [Sphingomonas sp. PP-F2F-A104-K0414]|uniref:hypothetical protein n=1 Tax=Sphingomonas sp. PP-F2F-A104-K0414 TaxID=2135661 RepID=UPI001048D8A8|nr:hypothetical protein [Sphingomonas sp. PP-F2F-A104-K0414]TCP98338.1 hypothetical protein C8J46_105494 [Sphingomonas sp. PP-F2F-A104-K0414]